MKPTMKRTLSLTGLFTALSLTGLFTALDLPAFAQVSPAPPLMNFQGRLAKPDGTPVPDGSHTVKFSLYNAVTGGTLLWTETDTVTVRNGAFATLLGNGAALTDATFAGNVWLQLTVDGGAALAPRQQILTSAYAFKANTVPDGSITNVKIAAGTITADKIAGGTALTLPFAATVNTASTPFSITNTGAGPSGAYFKTGGTNGLYAETTYTSGNGLVGVANAGTGAWGVEGLAMLGIGGYFKGGIYGAYGTSIDGIGVEGYSASNNGVVGVSNGAGGFAGVSGTDNNASGTGVAGYSTGSTGVYGAGAKYGGYFFSSTANGVYGANGAGSGLASLFGYGYGVRGDSDNGHGVVGTSGTGFGVIASANNGYGLYASSVSGTAVYVQGTSVLNGDTTIYGATTINGIATAHKVQIVGGSDVAEPYNIRQSGGTAPIAGMVVAIDPQRIGQMRVASRAYDRTVSGIISGANGVEPGITLTQKGTVADGSLPVASMGRVWAWCDADANGPIAAGDLLTTSATPGHAMRAKSGKRASGAILGKAMSPLAKGRGLVLVLVTLQ